VAVGSLLISTDTIMFPFLAGALALWLGLIAPGGGGRPDLAALAGALVGLAFLAKYAALYWLAFGALAALHPRARPDARDALALLAGLALVAAPNLAWNTANGLVTLSHTVDNTGWRGGLHLDPAGLARFLAEQALVFGPVALAALIVAAAGLIRRGPGPVEALLLLLCLPVVGLVALQALVSGANANWAAAAYLAGALLIVPLLLRSWPWRWGTLAMNGALALALPLAATQAESLRWGDRLLLARYVGLDELSRAALDLARAQGAAGIVAAERGVLADLLYTGRDAGVPIWAAPHQGPPRNHYEQRHALPREAPGPLILLQREAAALPCAPLAVTPLDSGPGAYRGRPFAAALVPRDCWAPR
jgi:4-amino-4-deoxy-L-arabinose transferase-like glycosyltransferase